MKQKSRKAAHEERLKDRTYKNYREQDNFQEQIAKHSMKFVKAEYKSVVDILRNYFVLEFISSLVGSKLNILMKA